MGKCYLFDIPHSYAGREQFSFTLTLLYTQAVGIYTFLSTLYHARATASNISDNKNQVFSIIPLSRLQVVKTHHYFWWIFFQFKDNAIPKKSHKLQDIPKTSKTTIIEEQQLLVKFLYAFSLRTFDVWITEKLHPILMAGLFYIIYSHVLKYSSIWSILSS